MTTKTIDIVFDGPPSHESGRFIEVERDGASIGIGKWIERPPYWVLQIPDPEAAASEARIKALEEAATACRVTRMGIRSDQDIHYKGRACEERIRALIDGVSDGS